LKSRRSKTGVWITIDPSDDGTARRLWSGVTLETIVELYDQHQAKFAVRNQVEAIDNMNPADDDIIVWLDVDGDRFAHQEFLTAC